MAVMVRGGGGVGVGWGWGWGVGVVWVVMVVGWEWYDGVGGEEDGGASTHFAIEEMYLPYCSKQLFQFRTW